MARARCWTGRLGASAPASWPARAPPAHVTVCSQAPVVLIIQQGRRPMHAQWRGPPAAARIGGRPPSAHACGRAGMCTAWAARRGWGARARRCCSCCPASAGTWRTWRRPAMRCRSCRCCRCWTRCRAARCGPAGRWLGRPPFAAVRSGILEWRTLACPVQQPLAAWRPAEVEGFAWVRTGAAHVAAHCPQQPGAALRGCWPVVTLAGQWYTLAEGSCWCFRCFTAEGTFHDRRLLL